MANDTIEEAAKAAFPPFDSSTFASQIFWLAVCFVVLYFVLSRIGLPKVAQIFDERQERIAKDQEEAERFRVQSEAAMEAYEISLEEARTEARDILSSRRGEAMAKADEKIKTKEAQLKSMIDETLARVDQEVQASLTEVKAAAELAAGEIVAQITGKAPKEKSLSAAVNKHFG